MADQEKPIEPQHGEVIAVRERVAYLGLESKLFASSWRESFQGRRWL